MEEIEKKLKMLDPARLPGHVAIIMDGNGRWARQRAMERSDGHAEGVNSVNRITRFSSDLGIKYLTLYAFSTENWNRPQAEVDTLMHLIGWTIRQETPELKANNVKIHILGETDRLPKEVRESLLQGVRETENCTGLNLLLCLSYSSRWEIKEAVRKIAHKVAAGEITPEAITDNDVALSLATAGMPDPDLLIRTGGDFRVSNFMLYQIAYTEIYLTPTYWPDFGDADLQEAIAAFQGRQRRFGLTGEQVEEGR